MSARDDKADGTLDSKRLEVKLRGSRSPLDRENAEKLARHRARWNAPELERDDRQPLLFEVTT